MVIMPSRVGTSMKGYKGPFKYAIVLVLICQKDVFARPLAGPCLPSGGRVDVRGDVNSGCFLLFFPCGVH